MIFKLFMTKKLNSYFTFILICFLSIRIAAYAANPNYMIKPKIISALDGDTIKIWTKERPVSVRLTGIDCYETSVNGHIQYQRNKGLTDEQIIEKGLKAKDELIKILRSNKNIYLEITGIDRKWGRYVGIFYYKDSKGRYISINDKMLKTGYCPQYIFKPYDEYIKYKR